LLSKNVVLITVVHILKILCYTIHQGPTLNGGSVSPKLEVHMTDMLLLLMVGI